MEHSIETWVSFVQENTVQPMDVRPRRPPRLPLFQVELVLREGDEAEGADGTKKNGIVDMYPSSQDIKNAMLAPLEAMVQHVSQLEILDADILTLLHLERKKLFDLTIAKNDVIYGTSYIGARATLIYID